MTSVVYFLHVWLQLGVVSVSVFYMNEEEEMNVRPGFPAQTPSTVCSKQPTLPQRHPDTECVHLQSCIMHQETANVYLSDLRQGAILIHRPVSTVAIYAQLCQIVQDRIKHYTIIHCYITRHILQHAEEELVNK